MEYVEFRIHKARSASMILLASIANIIGTCISETTTLSDASLSNTTLLNTTLVDDDLLHTHLSNTTEVDYKAAFKCKIFHNNYSKIFHLSPRMEGIPENLVLSILTFIGCLIIFYNINKNAWNYGKLALMNQGGDESMMEAEAGLLDELSTKSDSQKVYTGLNKETHRVNEKFRFFLVKAFTMLRLPNVLSFCGRDAEQYLIFQQYMILYLTVLTIVSILIILPINMNGGVLPKNEGLAISHTTIENVDVYSSFNFVHIAASFFYFYLAVFLMHTFRVGLAKYPPKKPDRCSVMIFNIMPSFCNVEFIELYLAKHYPNLVPKNVVIVYDDRNILHLLKLLGVNHRAQAWCMNYYNENGERYKMCQYPGGILCEYCNCFKVDAIQYYKNEERKIKKKLTQARNNQIPYGIAIIEFQTEDMANVIYEDFHKGRFNKATDSVRKSPILGAVEKQTKIFEDNIVFNQLGSTVDVVRRQMIIKEMIETLEILNPNEILAAVNEVEIFLQPMKWKIAYVRDADDIIWENVSLNLTYWHLRYIALNIFLIYVFTTFTRPVAVIKEVLGYFKTWMFSGQMSKGLEKVTHVLSHVQPSLLVLLLSAFIIEVIFATHSFLKYWTQAASEHAVMLYTYLYLLFLVVIIPSINLKVTEAFWLIYHDLNELYHWTCIFRPENGAFFTNYVITAAFTVSACELIRTRFYFCVLANACLAYSKADLKRIEHFNEEEFCYGYGYSTALLIFLIVMIFSVTCPIIAPFGLLYMIIKHFVDRYNIFFAFEPSKISRNIHITAMNFVILAPIMTQLSLLSIFLMEKNAWTFRTILTSTIVGISIFIQVCFNLLFKYPEASE